MCACAQGDPDAKVAGKAQFYLKRLLLQHPRMKTVVAKEVCAIDRTDYVVKIGVDLLSLCVCVCMLHHSDCSEPSVTHCSAVCVNVCV